MATVTPVTPVTPTISASPSTTATTTTTAATTPNKQTGKKSGIIIAVIVITVALAILLLYLYLKPEELPAAPPASTSGDCSCNEIDCPEDTPSSFA